MTGRLASRLLVQALIRQTEVEGGFAAVLHKGDPVAGSIMIQTLDADRQVRLFERVPDFSKDYVLAPIATQYSGDNMETAQYIERRLRSDPDLWVIELDIANAEQLAAVILTGD